MHSKYTFKIKKKVIKPQFYHANETIVFTVSPVSCHYFRMAKLPYLNSLANVAKCVSSVMFVQFCFLGPDCNFIRMQTA